MAQEDIADDIKEAFEKRSEESEISDSGEPEHAEVEIVE